MRLVICDYCGLYCKTTNKGVLPPHNTAVGADCWRCHTGSFMPVVDEIINEIISHGWNKSGITIRDWVGGYIPKNHPYKPYTE